MLIRNTLLCIASLCIAQNTLADIQVTIKDFEGSQSVIKLNDTWAKITDLSEPQHYMLLNMKSNDSYMVDNENKMTVKLEDMSEILGAIMEQPETQKRPKLEIIKKGSGPKVAGFNTTRYLLKAEGQLCGEHFISKEPLKYSEIKIFANAMQKQAENGSDMESFDSLCEYADAEFDKVALNYGIPLLSKDADGNETSRIVEFNTKISFSDNEFSSPKGYQQVSQNELMKREMTRAMSAMEKNPNMPSDEELEKLGEEVQHQLKQLEELLQQRAEN